MSAEVLELYKERFEGYDPLAGHPDPEALIMDSLNQSAMLAGREKAFSWELDGYLSEGALHRYRAVADIEAMIHLADNGPFDIVLAEHEVASLRAMYSPEEFDARTVTRIDHLGHNGKPPLEHDVKSVEVYLAERMDNMGLGHMKQWLHYAATSEDTNNIAYNLMLRDVTNDVVLPAVTRVADRLAHFAATHADAPMLGVTHAQNASPNTAGKRVGKSLHDITEVIRELEETKLTGKFGGAIGNHNPLVAMYPEFDWDEYSRDYVESFGFEYSPITDQRNNHLAVTRLLGNLSRVALTSHQAIQNMWLNIRDNIVVQKRVEGEVGSSTMSHKINPWRLENAEALFEQARSLISGAEAGLVESRDERDLSDHAWQRAYGDMVGRVVAGLNYFTTQLDRVTVSEERASSTLVGSAEVLSELLQTAGRSIGDPEAYNKAMAATQGRKLTLEEMRAVIKGTLPDGDIRDRLLAITPEEYVGFAGQKAREAVVGWHACKQIISKGVLDWRSRIDVALFDLDDTLVLGDKAELAARYEAARGELQADITPDELVDILRINGWSATINAFVTTHNAKHPDQLITAEQFTEVYRASEGAFDHIFTLADGAEELLDNLDSKGIRKGIVTARGPRSLPRVLDLYNLSGRFEATVHGQEVANGKPHPHPVGLALEKMRADGKRSMMVGDQQLNDIVAANAHGMMSVLVHDGELDPHGAVPTMHVKNLMQLATRFER